MRVIWESGMMLEPVLGHGYTTQTGLTVIYCCLILSLIIAPLPILCALQLSKTPEVGLAGGPGVTEVRAAVELPLLASPPEP